MVYQVVEDYLVEMGESIVNQLEIDLLTVRVLRGEMTKDEAIVYISDLGRPCECGALCGDVCPKCRAFEKAHERYDLIDF